MNIYSPGCGNTWRKTRKMILSYMRLIKKTIRGLKKANVWLCENAIFKALEYQNLSKRSLIIIWLHGSANITIESLDTILPTFFFLGTTSSISKMYNIVFSQTEKAISE